MPATPKPAGPLFGRPKFSKAQEAARVEAAAATASLVASHTERLAKIEVALGEIESMLKPSKGK